MNIFQKAISFYLDLIKSKSGLSHKRHISVQAFYGIIMFGLLDIKYDVPEIIYIILASLAGVQSSLSILEKKTKNEKDQL